MRRGTGWLVVSAAAVIWLAGLAAYLARLEVPAGWLRGTVVAEETGRSLPGVMINLHLTGPASGEEPQDFLLRSKPDGAFQSGRLPVGSYQLEATTEAHRLGPVYVDIAEGKVNRVALELKPIDPFFQIRVAQHIFLPAEKPEIIGHGFLPDRSVEFAIYRVDTAVLFREHEGYLRSLIYSEENGSRTAPENNPNLHLAQRLSLPITKTDAEGVFHQRFDLPVREPGVYLVAAASGSLRQLDWMMVTRLGLILKQWGDEALAYVVDLKTGEPVPHARVELSVEDRRLSGTTDDEGLFQVHLPKAEDSYTLLAMAEKDGSQAFVTDHVWREDSEGPERVYLYTDRPVYRPGHKVSFNGIARRFEQTHYTVMAGQPVQVEVRDPRETLVYRGQLATDRYGSYHGEFDLSEEAAVGDYQVVSTMTGRPHESSFAVAEYRKPEYTVKVTTDKKRYTRGERIQAQASAQYYFGGPVAGAEVSYQVQRSPYWFYPSEEDEDQGQADEEYGDGEYGGYGEVIETGTARTDDDGVARFTVGTRPSLQQRWTESREQAGDYEYTIEVTVTDPSRKSVTESGTALVTQGEFALEVAPESYIGQPGQNARIDISARDYENRPIRQAQVTIAAGREIWARDEAKFEPEAKGRVSTDAEGKAVFNFKPAKAGYYRIEAESQDRRGNRIFATDYLWVTREEYADFGVSYADLEIVADKKVYRSGDTAILLINTSAKGATALLTVEGPRLYTRRLVQLKGNSTRVQLPIQPEYAPNFFVSVAFVRDKQLFSREKRLRVSVEERRLKIDIRPDKSRYGPGEPARYDLRTTDWQGRPAPAQLSVGVVDEAIYAIRADDAPPMLSFFYPPRPNQVSTSDSFSQVYLDADKEGPSIAVRKRFPDTAYWNPAVVTDADGRARISFVMPDTLTTWRATVRGATLSTEVGEAVAKVRTSKDFLVRLEAPRFFVQRDRLVISAVVHNYTKASQEVEVWLKAPGLTFSGGSAASQRQRFALAPDGVRRQDWEIEVPSPGAKEVTVYAKTSTGLSDAMALTLPALPHGRERIEWRDGVVKQTATERLIVRDDSVPGASEAIIRLAPSLASVVLGGLEYLAAYPYGCTEQTMSAFLPDVVVARALKELDIRNPQLEKDLPKMVRKGLDRLYGFRHDDGGWGWWRCDESRPWMTAYVIYGLTLARQNGFLVNETVLSQGEEWLKRYLQQDREALSSDRLFTLYVLSLSGSDAPIEQQLARYYRRLDSLDGYRLALLTLTLSQRKQKKEAEAAARRLWAAAAGTSSVIWWKGRETWGETNDAEVTALAFQALYAINPQDERLFKVVRWFVINRQGNHWVSTRDTAFALLALTGFLKRSQELQPDYEAVVALNGRTLLSRRFTRQDLFGPEVEVKVPGRALRSGDNRLTLSKAGAGNLYYTVMFRQFTDHGELPQLITGSAISVQRAYYPLVSGRSSPARAITTSPAPNPTAEFRTGQQIRVRLTIKTPQALSYVVVEDPLPAGCEAEDRGDVDPWDWDYWWSDVEVRDEKVAVFAAHLPAGTSTIEYYLRPQIPGEYHVMPTEIYAMYNPDLHGSGAETRVTVR